MIFFKIRVYWTILWRTIFSLLTGYDIGIMILDAYKAGYEAGVMEGFQARTSFDLLKDQVQGVATKKKTKKKKR